MDALKADALNIGYQEELIVKELYMSIPKGKITVMIGANGCGKSTILKALGRILQPRKGTVYLNGADIHHLSTLEVAKQMAILPQSVQAPEGLTVGDLVSYGRYPHKKGFGALSGEDYEIVDWALGITNLSDLTCVPVDTLSGGQRQRAWIAMAIAQKTDVILLDEPTTYLDLSYQLEVLELLKHLNEVNGYTIGMVLHDINLAARHADYMIAIKNGKILKEGTPEEIMTREVLMKTYQIDAQIVMDQRTGRPICLSYDLVKTEEV